MNYALAREIYGTPWLVGADELQALLSMRQSFDLNQTENEVKNNTISVFDISSQETRLIERTYQLNNNDDFRGIGIVHINGPITVNGGASSNGMRQISAQMNRMASDPRIESFILIGDSGGGASAAVEIMSNTINQIRENKRVIGFIPEGGNMASACFGIMSACESIHAASGMSVVGSAGTMFMAQGVPANTTDANGVKHIRVYASASVRKNEAIEQALNTDENDLLVQELNIVNEEFLSLIMSNRPDMPKEILDGRTERAKSSVGRFIDGIASFNDVVAMLSVDDSTTQTSTSENQSNSNQKFNSMTAEELMQKHPATYNAVFQAGEGAGVKKEKARAGVWACYMDVDPEAVAEGIKSGEPLDDVTREEFKIKRDSKNDIDAMKNGSPKPVIPTAKKESGDTKKQDEKKEVEEAVNSYAAGIRSHLMGSQFKSQSENK